MSDNVNSLAFIKSMSRNGVATTTSMPPAKLSIWSSREAPPYTANTRRAHGRPIGSSTSATCNANSRVGTNTSPRGARGRPAASMRESIGTPNANVLPEPVRARPQRSAPVMATGIASV